MINAATGFASIFFGKFLARNWLWAKSSSSPFSFVGFRSTGRSIFTLHNSARISGSKHQGRQESKPLYKLGVAMERVMRATTPHSLVTASPCLRSNPLFHPKHQNSQSRVGNGRYVRELGFQQMALCRKQLTWRCAATTEGKQIGGKNQMLVYVPPHPLIKHWVSVLRNDFTPPPMFKSAMAELGRLLIYEASRDWLPTIEGEVNTPCGVAQVEFIDPRDPVKVVPILRAGLVLIEHSASLLPSNQTYHLGFVRDEETLQPSMYLNKLPEQFAEGSRVLVADPMLATGGTIVAAIEELKKRGADHKLMRVVAAVAAPPALKLLSEKFPGLRVYVGIIDEELNEKGYIVPGLGDAGDRSYGT